MVRAPKRRSLRLQSKDPDGTETVREDNTYEMFMGPVRKEGALDVKAMAIDDDDIGAFCAFFFCRPMSYCLPTDLEEEVLSSVENAHSKPAAESKERDETFAKFGMKDEHVMKVVRADTGID